MWFQKNKRKVIIPIIMITLLAAAFYFGGNSPDSKGWEISDNGPTLDVASENLPPLTTDPSGAPAADLPPAPKPQQPNSTPELSPEPTVEPQNETANLPEESPPPITETDDGLLNCTIYIQCETIINNLDLCDPDKAGIVPGNGWVLENTEITFTEGETVLGVLQRVCRERGIHMEHSESPMYGNVYIEGIANLYEFDVGSLSGWMYKVNGWFPNYSCSQYTLKDGDLIGWVYTCDLGNDVGGGYAAGSQ